MHANTQVPPYDHAFDAEWEDQFKALSKIFAGLESLYVSGTLSPEASTRLKTQLDALRKYRDFEKDWKERPENGDPRTEAEVKEDSQKLAAGQPVAPRGYDRSTLQDGANAPLAPGASPVGNSRATSEAQRAGKATANRTAAQGRVAAKTAKTGKAGAGNKNRLIAG